MRAQRGKTGDASAENSGGNKRVGDRLKNGVADLKEEDAVPELGQWGTAQAAFSATRKKLPWLEPRPVNVTSGDLSKAAKATTSECSPHPLGCPGPDVERKLSCTSLSDDPSLRPIGSEPTVGNGKIVALQPKSYSQTSQRPPGLRATSLGKKKQHMSDSDSPKYSYASSEYSTSNPSDREYLPVASRGAGPKFHEHVIANIGRSQGTRTNAHHIAKKSQQDGLAVMSSESATTAGNTQAALKGTTTLKPNPIRTLSPEPIERRRECRSCESAMFEGVPPQNMATTVRKKTLPTAPEPPLIIKKSTLPSLPPHLMASSSTPSSPSSELQLHSPDVRLISRKTISKSLAHNGADLERTAHKPHATHTVVRPGRQEALKYVLEGATRAVSGPNVIRSEAPDPLPLSSPALATSSGLDLSPRSARPSAPLPDGLPSDDSMSHTPPQLYQPSSVESIVKDFAYTPNLRRNPSHRSFDQALYGAAASFYRDHGESVATQPGFRHNIDPPGQGLPSLPPAAHKRRQSMLAKHARVHKSHGLRLGKESPLHASSVGSRRPERPLRRKKATGIEGVRSVEPAVTGTGERKGEGHEHGRPRKHRHQISRLLESPCYRDDDGTSRRPSNAPGSNGRYGLSNVSCRNHFSDMCSQQMHQPETSAKDAHLTQGHRWVPY